MKKYKYTALDIDHKKFNGIFYAEDEEHLREFLSNNNLYLVSFKVVSDKSPNPFFTVSGKVSLKEITSFCRQLSVMISSKIELINCLEILKTQSYSNYFKQVLEIIYEDVKSGKLLYDAMDKHKKVFPDFFRSMIYVGEMSSSLDKVLVNVANYYENESKLKSKLKSAMIYPIVLSVLIVGIIILLTVFVIPIFKESFAKLDVEMPGLTMALFNISDFILGNWKLIVLFVAVLFLALYFFKKSKSGVMFFDKMKIKIPIIRKYQVSKITSKFCRGFGLLIESGMNIIDALEVIEKVLGNVYVREKFRGAIEDVKKGESLTNALDKLDLFPQVLIQMVKVGEKTANMSTVLMKSCDYFDSELENNLNAVMSLIQPTMILILGAVIAVVFMAVYSPILSLMQSLT